MTLLFSFPLLYKTKCGFDLNDWNELDCEVQSIPAQFIQSILYSMMYFFSLHVVFPCRALSKTLLFPTVHWNLEALHVKWRNLTPLYVSLTERGNEFIKYFTPPSENQTHNRRIYSHTLVPLCHNNLFINIVIKY